MRIRFNKPYQVFCQFTDRAGRRTLSRLCAGARRLSRRSARLRQRSAPLLTDDGALQALIADPRHGLEKTSWAKVEGLPRPETLERLRRGVALKDGRTRPARVRLIAEPKDLWPREPPIRHRAVIATAWPEISLHEGRNRP